MIETKLEIEKKIHDNLVQTISNYKRSAGPLKLDQRFNDKEINEKRDEIVKLTTLLLLDVQSQALNPSYSISVRIKQHVPIKHWGEPEDE